MQEPVGVSTMAYFVGTLGSDQFLGTALAEDTFEFSVAALSASDTVAGGGLSATAARDTLKITSAGTINFVNLVNVSGIETIKLSGGGNEVRLTHALAASARNHSLEVIGNAGGDHIWSPNADRLQNTDSLSVNAYGGNDTVSGGLGNDVLRGGVGRDNLSGRNGTDHLFGGAGIDFLAGGGGKDVIAGGQGNDTFIFNSVSESPASTTERDVISDFVAGQDRMDLFQIEAKIGGFNSHFEYIGAAKFSAAGQIRAVQAGDNAVIFVNTSGQDGAEMSFVLKNVQASDLAASDFRIRAFSGKVAPKAETPPVAGTSDTADDPAIWVNKANPAKSAIIGTNKDDSLGGLHVYNLKGQQIDHFSNGSSYNNVDIRYHFRLGGEFIDLVGATNRTTDSIDFFAIDPVTRELSKVGTVATGLSNVYGFTLAHTADGKFFAYATTTDGVVQQFRIGGAGGIITGHLVRTFDVGSQSEGITVDDRTGAVYVTEENVGIWKYDGAPASGSSRVLVDSIANGHLKADVEGGTIYYGSNGTGYLIVSSQGNSTFAVYDIKTNQYLGSFGVGAASGIDEVSKTDGLDVTNVALGPSYSKGMLVVHDHENTGGQASNYKFIPWEEIAALGHLTVDTSHDPVDGWYL